MNEIPNFRYRRSEWESNNKPINTDIKNGFNIYNDVESQESEFNDKRTTKRRKAPTITDIRQPFNPENFNFTKIKADDINLVVINDSPVDVGHVLLVPRINQCLPQVCE
ncbi:hypothetical protein QZH41_014049 [Actinostola sp. cb2023]|nr:hypothetical protein QZH41_014049 [Actinostola sp. cb2023]